MKGVVIYTRTSREEQNPENQLADCTRLAKELGFADFEVLEEKASAWKESVDRPVFESLRQGIIQSKVKHIIVWDFDRLFRNRKRTVEFIRAYSKLGLKVHSYRQQWLEQLNKAPEPWGEIMADFMLNVVAWIAQEESDKKSQRVKAAYQRLMQDGRRKRWGRPEVKANAAQVRQLRQQGLSIRKIAVALGINKDKVARTLSQKAQAETP